MLDEIQLEFMVCGHSYMPCDHVFGWIEEGIKKVPKINTPLEYEPIIRNARRAKVTTVQMAQHDFFDIKGLMDLVTVRKPKKPLLFSKGRNFTMTKDKPWSYQITSDRGRQEITLDKRFSKGPPTKRKGKAPPPPPAPLLTTKQLVKPYIGYVIGIDDTKIRHLGELQRFLTQDGRDWVEKVINEQSTSSVMEDNIFDEEEQDDDIENRADESSQIYAAVPAPASVD